VARLTVVHASEIARVVGFLWFLWGTGALFVGTVELHARAAQALVNFGPANGGLDLV
jgi:hypothetical protein